MNQMVLPPLSLYIHIPWCVQKCPYCDFNSHAQPEVIPEQAYVSCLLDDLDKDLKYAQGRKIHSVFIGGGTPSLFSAEAIERLLQGVQQRLEFEPDIEITLEANPGTFETERFAGFQRAGVNRLSIGVQSLQHQQLQRLGRIHNPQQAQDAARHAAQLPLTSFNLDLMHGLPDQTLETALTDLKGIIALQPPHISWYQLTIEPNTLFASHPPELPEDDTLWEIYQQGHQLLSQAGYEQYEVSAYGQPGHRSRHNLNYWRFGDYLGIGTGAHGKITLPDQGTILRTEKIKHPRGYLDLTRDYLWRSWNVAEQERVFEYFMNRLRLIEPVPRAEFEQYTGLPAELADQALAPAIDQGLITPDSVPQGNSTWKTTKLGRLHLNKVLADLIAE